MNPNNIFLIHLPTSFRSQYACQLRKTSWSLNKQHLPWGIFTDKLAFPKQTLFNALPVTSKRVATWKFIKSTMQRNGTSISVICSYSVRTKPQLTFHLQNHHRSQTEEVITTTFFCSILITIRLQLYFLI